MRRLLVVSLWVVATVGVTYVASAAVTLVDLQVFPQGERVEVLTRPAPPPTTTILPVKGHAYVKRQTIHALLHTCKTAA